jgi:hypothetical protein
MPGDPLYPVKRGIERVRLTIARDEQVQAELHLALAGRRLEEAIFLAEEERQEGLEGLLEEYVQELEITSQVPVEVATSADDIRPADEEHLAQVEKATAWHTEVLTAVLAKAPDSAKPGLQKALEASRKGQERALQALERSGPSSAPPRGSSVSAPVRPKEPGVHSTNEDPGSIIHVGSLVMSYERKGPNYFINTKVTIVDQDRRPVPDASVHIETELPDGSLSFHLGNTTGNGTVTSRVRSRQSGIYTSTVRSVSRSDLSYDPAANVDTSRSLAVP